MYLSRDKEVLKGSLALPTTSANGLAAVFKSPPDDRAMILHPVSGQLKVKLKKDPSAEPHADLSGLLHTITLSLASAQYQALLTVVAGLSTAQQQITQQMTALVPFRSLGSEEQGEQSRYIEAYKATLNAAWLQEVKEGSPARLCLERAERECSYDALGKARQQAFLEMRQQLKGKAVTRRGEDQAEKKGMFGGFFSRRKKEEVSDNTLSADDQEAIFQELLAFDPEVEQRRLAQSPHFIDMRLHFQLDSFKVALLDERYQPLLHTVAMRTVVDLTLMREALDCRLQLGTFECVDDALTGTSRTHVVRSLSVGGTPLIDVTFQQNPQGRDIDQCVEVLMQRAEVTVHAPLLATISDFFAPKTAVDLSVVRVTSLRIPNLCYDISVLVTCLLPTLSPFPNPQPPLAGLVQRGGHCTPGQHFQVTRGLPSRTHLHRYQRTHLFSFFTFWSISTVLF
jgi:hypothetical protein